MRQEAGDPVGQWTRQIDSLARHRVKEGKPGGVQRHAAQVLDEIRPEASPKKLFISIAAGFQLRRLEAGL